VSILSISPQEHEARIERARALMREQEIDALVLSGLANLRYFAGFAPHIYVSPTRPWFAVVPLVGEPVALVPEMGHADTAAQSWLGRIETWASPRPHDEGVSDLVRLVKAASTRFGRVGFELGPESRLGMPVADILRLRDLLSSGVEIVDCVPIYRRLRARKSPAEVALIQAATDAAQRAFEAVPSLARQGASESDLHRAFQIEALKAGADQVPYVALATGRGGYDSITRGPRSGKVLRNADVLGLDTGVTVGGYWTDYNRNWAIGTATKTAQEVYERLWNAQAQALEHLRPGMSASSLWRILAEGTTGTDANSVTGRLGHGVGLDYTEPPSLHPLDATILEPGMVIALEPSLTSIHSDGEARFMALEEDILVTETGAALLTKRASASLPII
jgi:Xaa-Pro aminopeptidase